MSEVVMGPGPLSIPPPVTGCRQLDAILRAVPPSRMVDYGATALEAQALVGKVTSGKRWVDAALELVDQRTSGARLARAAGLRCVAAGNHLAAAALGMIGQLGCTEDTPERRSVYRGAVSEYLHADMAERLEVQDGSDHLVAWIRLPAHPNPRALAIIWGGTSGWGLVYHGMGETLMSRGFAVALVELPGQGEPRLFHGSHLRLEVLGSLLERLVDAMGRRMTVRPAVAIVGNSVGGLVAAHVARSGLSIDACVINGGITEPSTVLRAFPRQEALWRLFLGAKSALELESGLHGLTFSAHAGPIRCPVLVLHGEADRLSTLDDARRFAASVVGGDVLLVRFPNGEHCLYSRAQERNTLIAEWLSVHVEV